MNNAALAAGASVFFTVNNSLAGTMDTPIVTVSYPGSGQYAAWVSASAAGGFEVSVKNNTSGSLSDAVVLNFAIIKGATP